MHFNAGALRLRACRAKFTCKRLVGERGRRAQRASADGRTGCCKRCNLRGRNVRARTPMVMRDQSDNCSCPERREAMGPR